MSIEVFRKAPSLQHAIKKLGPSAEQTAQHIIEARNKPFTINTFGSRKYLTALLKGLDFEMVVRAASSEPNKNIKKAALEMLPLMNDFINQHELVWFREISPITVLLSPTVSSSANPIGIARLANKICVLWPQTWKYDSLDAFQFNLLMTIMKKQFIDQYDEYDDVFWIEMSAPNARSDRELNVRGLDAARQLEAKELDAVGKNLELALAIADSAPKKGPNKPKKPDLNQSDFGF